MFYLTKGILNILYNKTVIERAVLNDKPKIVIEQPLPIVQVINLIDYEHHYLLMLFDGQSQKEFIIEKSFLDNMIDLNKKYIKRKTDENLKLKNGSFIQFDTCNYCKISDIKRKYQIEVAEPNKFIVNLFTLYFLGFEEIQEKIEIFSKNDNDNLNTNPVNSVVNKYIYKLKETIRDKKGRDQFGTYSIRSINLKLNYNDWKIRAYLKRISLISESNVAKKKKTDLNFRLLFLDLSGYIQLIFKNELINARFLEQFELDRIYIVSGADIRTYNLKQSPWAEDFLYMDYELHVNEKTKIVIYPLSNESNMNELELKNHTFDGELFHFSQISFLNKFDKTVLDKICFLGDLQYKKSRDYVTILGIMHKKDENFKVIMKDNQSNVNLRYFYIVDKSKISTTCTVFGVVAESFPFNIGDVLVIENCELTDNGGISLLIRDKTNIYKLKPNEHVRIAELYEWWSNEWWQSRNNYIKVDSFKRKSDSIEEFGAKKFKL